MVCVMAISHFSPSCIMLLPCSSTSDHYKQLSHIRFNREQYERTQTTDAPASPMVRIRARILLERL